jgi:peptidoglycan/LPS O-acetylase OafA/YrhL
MNAPPLLASERALTSSSPTLDRRSAPVVGQAHVRSLDGIRFFAFFGVFVFHALQNNPRLRPWVTYGSLGVQVFFVLSGFLIGGILIDLQTQTEIPLATRLKTFYIRRALRIFPLYYMVLLVLLALPLVGITAIGGREFFFWNAAYLTNIKMYFDGGSGGMGGLSHFWSLSVEEHFYLISPLLMLTVPTRTLSVGFVGLWVACAVARLVAGLRGDGELYLLSPLQFDCMTLGIAAAMIQARGEFLGVDSSRAMTIAKRCGLAILPLFALRHVPWSWAQIAGATLEHWVFAAAVAGFVLSVWQSGNTRISRFLSIAPLPYLGKISYALYVFHLPCLVLAYVWFSPYLNHGTAIPALAMTVLLSMVSWRWFEGPINDQKRRFPYHGRARGAASAIRPA